MSFESWRNGVVVWYEVYLEVIGIIVENLLFVCVDVFFKGVFFCWFGLYIEEGFEWEYFDLLL